MSTNEYERALLGVALNGYRDLPRILRTVDANDFDGGMAEGEIDHKHIWRAVEALHTAGHRVAPLTVKDKLGATANALYLHDLMTEAYVDPAWAAGKVREGRIRRNIAALGVRCNQMLTDADTSPDELITKIRMWADEITTTNPDDNSGDIGTALEAAILIAEKGEEQGVMSPWSSLNELVDGFRPGELWVIAARPGVGKSIALENIATHIARQGRWVSFASLEMSDVSITQRTLSHTARVHLSKLRHGREALTEVEWNDIAAASETIRSTRIRFAVGSTQTVASIRAEAWDVAQRAKRLGEPFSAVVVDYVQLITAASDTKGMTRQQQIGTFTRGLKALARELHVPVIIAAQLRRHEERPPTMSDLREAGDIENDADGVVLLHEEEVDDGSGAKMPTGYIDFIVDKNRNGPRGTRRAQKWGAYSKIADAS